MVGMEEINQVGMGLIAYAKASVFKPVYFLYTKMLVWDFLKRPFRKKWVQ